MMTLHLKINESAATIIKNHCAGDGRALTKGRFVKFTSNEISDREKTPAALKPTRKDSAGNSHSEVNRSRKDSAGKLETEKDGKPVAQEQADAYKKAKKRTPGFSERRSLCLRGRAPTKLFDYRMAAITYR